MSSDLNPFSDFNAFMNNTSKRNASSRAAKPLRPASTRKPGQAIRVLIADDHTVVREALHSFLDSEPGISVVGEAENGRMALEMVLSMRPDVLLMDIGMPRLNGLEAARQIRHAVPATRILMLSAFSSDLHIRQAVEADADGYLLKDSSGEVLTNGIREVAAGKKFFSVAISRRMKMLFQEQPYHRGLEEKKAMRLTARENEVLQLIAEGGANKQIASELGISIKTVEKHRQNLMEKLHIHETAGLTRYAISSGIVDSSIQAAEIV